MFGPLSSLPEIVLRSLIVYLTIIFAFRLVGKRHISQLSLVDFALVLLVSNAVQNAMVGNDSSLSGGIVAALTLIFVNILLTKLVLKDERAGEFIQGEPSLLVRNGRPSLPNLEKEHIRLEELEEAVREHGIENISDVKAAILELDGSISVIPFENGGGEHVEHHIAPLSRRKRSRRGLGPM
jgi:uncharacterized membrane protein YcaP (DUF421 family)